MQAFDDHLASQRERFIDELKSFVRQPSVAATHSASAFPPLIVPRETVMMGMVLPFVGRDASSMPSRAASPSAPQVAP